MDQAATVASDYQALTEGAAFIDFSNRGRLCLIGADRQNFINGQVTNNVKNLKPGQGCYAALANAKGKMTSDLNIFVLENEILLDFEPGLIEAVRDRLQKFIIADDVEIVDATRDYGLLSIIGPTSGEQVGQAGFPVPATPFSISKTHGESYVAATPRIGGPAVDIFYPMDDATLPNEFKRLPRCSMDALETVRIERGIPRFGVDMNENTLVPEALGENAISYSKGCYIGQEVIARIRTYGQVAKALRRIHLDPAAETPKSGDKILNDGKEVGWITSATLSPKFGRPVALGYVRKECNQIGTRLLVNNFVADLV
jgi:tRNA-modifying protein YgfZ